ATNVDDQTTENISRDIKIETVRAHHPNETAAMTADETVLPTKVHREEAVPVTTETATTHPEVDNPLHHLHGTPIPTLEDVNMDPLEGEDEEATMRRIMGFEGFRSTKNTKVPGNDKNYAVSKVKKAEYRQYMNRVGGFNRPLSPSRG
ncbi:hypothetical protein KC316_g19467, partial [Hortaea werneckii]